MSKSNTKAVVIVSGGLDSVTLAHVLKAQGYDLLVLSIDYGQRHKKELEYAQRCAQRLGGVWRCVDLSSLQGLLHGSALTTQEIEVPDGHYEDETMRITVVPNRNAIFLTVAYGWAVAELATVVAVGVHAGDHAIYPDCRPEFIESFAAMQQEAVRGFGHEKLHLEAPFVYLSKQQIVRMGASLGVPFEETWSCYKGGELHCGTCSTCVERQEAFALAGVSDPTLYLQKTVLA